MRYLPEGFLLSSEENQAALSAPARLKAAFYGGRLLEGRALLCDSMHNLHVDLGCMRGMIPREEGALGISDGTVRDIALISRVNKPVVFRVLGFHTDAKGEPIALLSRKQVQQACREEYLAHLQPGDIIDAVVTHLEGFGAFCDIGAGLNALLPVDCICVSRIPHPRARFSPGQRIKAVVRAIDERGRITLSHKELLGTWEENSAAVQVGETVSGIVRSVESYGIFVELKPNLAGLAEYTWGVDPGAHASVYVKNILPERMKIKLILVDAFRADYPPEPMTYYIESGRLNRWVYSPPGSEKVIDSRFE